MLRRVRDWLFAHRRRTARLILVAMVAVIGIELAQSYPRTVDLRYDLHEARHDVEEVRVAYRQGHAEIATASFHYPRRAPEAIRHSVELSPGEYEIVANVRDGNHWVTHTRRLTVPADGLVIVDLSR